MEYPLIVCQVPHQKRPFARIINNAHELYDFAIYCGGDNWDFPGHLEGDDWVDMSCEADWCCAISHDMHATYFLEKDNVLSDADFVTSHHQKDRARIEILKLAVELGWVEPDNEETDDDD